MEAFARHLEGAGHRVLHLDLDATADFDDLPALLRHLVGETGAEYARRRPTCVLRTAAGRHSRSIRHTR